MFSKDITDTDEFLEMPLSSQALYFHLGMQADDDWFVSPKRVMRTIQAKDDDLKILMYKRFIIVFQSGVIVITHWRINNQLRKDRSKPTLYQEEKNSLLNKDGYYLASESGNQMTTKCPPSIGKDSIDEYSIDKGRFLEKTNLDTNEEKIYSSEFLEFRKEYPNKKSKKKSQEAYNKALKITTSSVLLEASKMYALANAWKDKKYIAHATTRLNWERREDEDIEVDKIILIKDPSEYEHWLGEYLHHLYYLKHPLFNELTEWREWIENRNAEANYKSMNRSHLQQNYDPKKREEALQLFNK